MLREDINIWQHRAPSNRSRSSCSGSRAHEVMFTVYASYQNLSMQDSFTGKCPQKHSISCSYSYAFKPCHMTDNYLYRDHTTLPHRKRRLRLKRKRGFLNLDEQISHKFPWFHIFFLTLSESLVSKLSIYKLVTLMCSIFRYKI